MTSERGAIINSILVKVVGSEQERTKHLLLYTAALHNAPALLLVQINLEWLSPRAGKTRGRCELVSDIASIFHLGLVLNTETCEKRPVRGQEGYRCSLARLTYILGFLCSFVCGHSSPLVRAQASSWNPHSPFVGPIEPAFPQNKRHSQHKNVSSSTWAGALSAHWPPPWLSIFP